MTQKSCLCDSGFVYDACCGPYHNGEKSGLTAISLMRSRYTAYAMQNEPYLLHTWEKSKCPKRIDFAKDQANWQKLEIINSKKGQEKDLKGIVEFKAVYLLEGEDYVMHEISRFRKVHGHWLYHDGVVKSIAKVATQQSNHGLNAACSCGSGKKFKRCCGKS